jgi:hypothetical protein
VSVKLISFHVVREREGGGVLQEPQLLSLDFW